MKKIKYYTPCICGFEAVLVKGVREDDFNISRQIEVNIHKDNMHESEFFNSYFDAQDYLFKKLQEDNEYYYGRINEFRFDVDYSKENRFGECREYICASEIWAYDYEED